MNEIELNLSRTYSHCPLTDDERAHLAMLVSLKVEHDIPNVSCRPYLSGVDIAKNPSLYRLVKCVCVYIADDAFRYAEEP